LAQSISHGLVSALRSIPDFQALDDLALLEVVGASTNLFWSKGSTVFRRGDPAEALYVVLSGRVGIAESGDGDEANGANGAEIAEIAEIEPGDYFGEHSLLLHTTHSKTATALADTELIVVPRESLSPVLDANPELAAHIRRKLEARLLERSGGPGGAGTPTDP